MTLLKMGGYNMIRQKAISVKIDYNVLHDLEQEVSTSGINRNKLINYAIWYYTRHKDAQRQYVCKIMTEKEYIDSTFLEPHF